MSVSFTARVSAVLLVALLISGASPVFGQSLKVSGFENLNAGTWDGFSTIKLADTTLCVYKKSGNKAYAVTASGTGAGGAFRLSNGSSTLSYEVGWKNSAGSSGQYENLKANSPQEFQGAHSSSPTCNGTYNAALQVSFPASKLGAARPGNYSGTLTIMISPL